MEKETQDQIYRENKALLDQIKSAHNLSAPFAQPVIELYPNVADNYLQTISDPIDLRTITEKLERRVYICPEMMLADLHRYYLHSFAYFFLILFLFISYFPE